MTVVFVLAVIAVGSAVVAWRLAERDLRAAERERDRLAWQSRHQREVIRRYRAEFWELTDLTPPAARAALTPDDPSLLPTEVEQWLRTQEKP